MVHIRFEGRSLDRNEKDLGLSAAMRDDEIKSRVAQHLDIGQERLARYVVDRIENGNIVLRPEAIYG